MRRMAGSPLKRAKREAEARAERLAQQVAELGGTIPDADESPAEAPPPRPRAFMPPLRAVPPQPQLGPQARRVSDSVHSSELQQLARVLRPGLTCSIERLKPQWCAGYVEGEYQLDHSSVPQLITYLRTEWGGELYRVSVLQHDGSVAFEARIPISGPPRELGREIARYPVQAPDPQPTRVAAPAQPATPEMLHMLEHTLAMVGGLMEKQHSAFQSRMDTSQRDEAQRLERLVSALVDTRKADAQASAQPSMVESLREFAKTHNAMQRFAEAFAPKQVAAGGEGGADDDDGMKAVMKEAQKHFISNAVGSFFAGRQPSGARRVAPPQQQQVANTNAPPYTHAPTRARMPAREPMQKPAENDEIADG